LNTSTRSCALRGLVFGPNLIAGHRDPYKPRPAAGQGACQSSRHNGMAGAPRLPRPIIFRLLCTVLRPTVQDTTSEEGILNSGGSPRTFYCPKRCSKNNRGTVFSRPSRAAKKDQDSIGLGAQPYMDQHTESSLRRPFLPRGPSRAARLRRPRVVDLLRRGARRRRVPGPRGFL
jgi:hypothetical protein